MPTIPSVLHCNYCRRWLIDQDVEVAKIPASPKIELLWNAYAVLDLIRISSNARINREALLTFVKAVVDTVADGNTAEFCRMLGLHPKAFYRWFAYGEKTTLEALLRLCFRLNIWPSTALTFSVHEAVPKIRPVSGPKRNKAGGGFGDSKEMLLKLLEREETLPSLSFIANGVQTTRSTLKRRYPDLCRRIVERRITERKQRTAEMLAKQARIIGELVEQMRNAGIRPGRKRVEEEIRRHGFSLMTQQNLVAFRKAYVSAMGLVPMAAKTDPQKSL